MSRTLLIDADILLHRFCRKAGGDYGLESGPWVDLDEAAQLLDAEVRDLRHRLDADQVRLAFSDPEANWRKKLLPTYKAHRKRKKPPGFFRLREYARQHYRALWQPTLEADDVLGIWTTGRAIKGEKIIVSIDKDMRTLPGLLYNPMREDEGIVEITREEADRNHLMQTLMGDSCDGYSGVPYVGPLRAAKILGEEPSWAAVVAAFQDKGLTEDDALVQARVARILRVGEWSQRQGVHLWKPTPRFTIYGS